MRPLLLLPFLALACARQQGEPADVTSDADTAIALRDSGATPDDDEQQTCAYEAPRWECWIGRGIVVQVRAIDDTNGRLGDSSTARILVTSVRGGGAPQVLGAPDMSEPDAEPDVTVADLDGDGYRDLRIQRKWGHPNNDGRHTFRYHAATRRFELDELLTEETNVVADSTGCVRTSGWLGGGDTIERRYCLAVDGWLLQWEKRTEDMSIERYYEMRNGQLVLLRVDTLPP